MHIYWLNTHLLNLSMGYLVSKYVLLTSLLTITRQTPRIPLQPHNCTATQDKASEHLSVSYRASWTVCVGPVGPAVFLAAASGSSPCDWHSERCPSAPTETHFMTLQHGPLHTDARNKACFHLFCKFHEGTF